MDVRRQEEESADADEEEFAATAAELEDGVSLLQLTASSSSATARAPRRLQSHTPKSKYSRLQQREGGESTHGFASAAADDVLHIT